MRPRSWPKSSPNTAADVYRYEWAGLGLTTDFALPELPETPALSLPGRDWQLRRAHGRARGRLRTPRRWFHDWRAPDERPWLSFARHRGGYRLRFRDFADFDVCLSRRLITGHARRGTPDHTFNHLLLDQVMPLVIGAADCFALHGSVVDIDGGAVAFLGATGHGKSTLAACLSRRGHAVLSDDCCVLWRTSAGFDVAPTYPGLRLFSESISQVFGDVESPRVRVSHYSSKERIVPRTPAARAPGQRVPLRRLYVIPPPAQLSGADRARIDRRTWREGTLDVVGATFYLDVKDEGRAREGFELAAEAAGSSRVRVLTFPWNLAALETVADEVLDDLRR
jgi:hypothetical protein